MRRLLIVVAVIVLASAATGAGESAPSGVKAPTQPSDGCGQPSLRSSAHPWVCTFDDEFDGVSLDWTRWWPQTSGFSTGSADRGACYVADPANVSVGGGSLNLTVRELPEPEPCQSDPSRGASSYTSGMVSTYHRFSQQYGRFEARVKVSAASAPGLQESFWLWPDDRVASAVRWPEAGEIDVIETYSVVPHVGIPYLHYTETDNGGAIDGTNTAWDCAAQRGVFNTYTLEWTPTELKILVNGRVCLVNTSGDPAFRKPYIVAFTQALGNGANSYDGRAELPATMSIDYVRVWK